MQRQLSTRSTARKARASPARSIPDGNMGHRPRRQGRLFPGAAGRQRRATCAPRCCRSCSTWASTSRSTTTRWRRRQHELGFTFDTLVKTADNMQIYKYVRPQRRPQLRQDRDLHAEADLRRQRLGHAHPPVDLEGRQAAVRRQSAMPTCRRRRSTTSAASSSTPRRSTPSPTRRPTATSG